MEKSKLLDFSIMPVFWSLAFLVRNNVALAVYLLSSAAFFFTVMELIKQPSSAACGQACIAMISGKDCVAQYVKIKSMTVSMRNEGMGMIVKVRERKGRLDLPIACEPEPFLTPLISPIRNSFFTVQDNLFTNCSFMRLSQLIYPIDNFACWTHN